MQWLVSTFMMLQLLWPGTGQDSMRGLVSAPCWRPQETQRLGAGVP